MFPLDLLRTQHLYVSVNMDYGIFDLPTRSFNTCVYTANTHVLDLYLFCKTEWLGGGGGLWIPFFNLGGPLCPLL